MDAPDIEDVHKKPRKTKTLPIITKSELAKHNTAKDAWIALSGRVYDITSYISKHPGGVPPLLNSIGKDGTKSFNAVHPYVDFKKILKGLDKGILEGAIGGLKKSVLLTLDSNDERRLSTASTGSRNGRKSTGSLNSIKRQSNESQYEGNDGGSGLSRLFCCICGSGKRKSESDSRLPATEFFDSPSAVIYEVLFSQGPSTENDWSVGVVKGSLLVVRKFIDPVNVWVSGYRLLNSLPPNNPVHLTFKNEFNTCEVTIKKPEHSVWQNLGKPDSTNDVIIPSRTSSGAVDAFIAVKEALTKDVNLYGIALSPSSVFGVKIGHHLQIYIDENTSKPYTPVCYSMTGKLPPAKIPPSLQLIWFVIKTYSDGKVTKLLDNIPVAHSFEGQMKYTLKLGFPQGIFDLSFLLSAELLVLMAAGTGITPMTKIIEWTMIRNQKGTGKLKVVLIFWCRDQDELIMRDKFEKIESKEGGDWFLFFPVLTKAPSSWTGLVGRPDTTQIQGILNNIPSEFHSVRQKHAIICGSDGFNRCVEGATSEIFLSDNTFIFEG